MEVSNENKKETISRELIDKVINNADIVSIISNYIPLTKKGSDYKGVCPFHNDTDPSLSVSPTKKVFKCFSCGTAGNVVGFVQKFKNISFIEALKEVAETVGIKIETGRVNEQDIQNNKLINIMENASKFYAFYLNNSKEGVQALEYLHNRKLTDEVISKFNIGLSSDSGDLLYKSLTEKNYLPLDIVQTGLIKESHNNSYYDSFRNRIMFPITNLYGKTVAFSGRLYNKQKDDNNPKYINSSDSVIFKKGNILYNYYESMNTIKNNDCCYIFEGFMDVIAAYRGKVYNAVATMGTALTPEQIRAISKLTKNVVLCYDGDDPGINATKKAIKMLVACHMNVKVVTLPVGMDPDEFINEHGEEKLHEVLVNEPTSALDYLYNIEKRNLFIEDYSSIENYKRNLFSYMHYFKSTTLNEMLFKKMAADLNVSIEALKNDFGSLGGVEVMYPTNEPTYGEGTFIPDVTYTVDVPPFIDSPENKGSDNKYKDIEKAEQQLLNLALKDKDICRIIDNKLNNMYFKEENFALLGSIMTYYYHNDIMNLEKFESNLDEVSKQVLALVLNVTGVPPVTEIDTLVNIVSESNEAKLVSEISSKGNKTAKDIELAIKLQKKRIKPKRYQK